jgi:hypothetical protein
MSSVSFLRFRPFPLQSAGVSTPIVASGPGRRRERARTNSLERRPINLLNTSMSTYDANYSALA